MVLPAHSHSQIWSQGDGSRDHSEYTKNPLQQHNNFVFLVEHVSSFVQVYDCLCENTALFVFSDQHNGREMI
jgi:hypothetical protein